MIVLFLRQQSYSLLTLLSGASRVICVRTKLSENNLDSALVAALLGSCQGASSTQTSKKTFTFSKLQIQWERRLMASSEIRMYIIIFFQHSGNHHRGAQ